MVAYWNRALLLMAVDNEEQLITHLQSALEHIDTFIKQLNQLIELDEIDRPEDLNHALDLSVQVLDRLSDLFAEQGDNADSPLDERTKALKQAIVYSQKALAAQQELAPEETHINLHLTYLNLQDSLFQLTKDQVYLQQSSDYIRRYRLDGDFPTLVQLEIKAHQFSIARFLEPKQAREAQSIAQRIMTLGRVNDNPVLAEVYDSAETYLRASIPRPRDVFFAAPEREEGNHPNVGKRKHEDEGATQIDKKSKELSKLDILVEAAASAQRMF